MEKFKIYPEFKQQLIDRAKRIGLNLNLDNPVTIQDKINWMKLYDSTPLKTHCADKIQVHDYCKEKLGVDLCIPILKIYEKVEDINWSELPNKFVIKCNHGSGMNIIVRDKTKLDIKETEKKLQKFMNDDFAFHVGYEMHYHDIRHKIFVEEYKEDASQKSSLLDYKFWCFDGDPKFMTIGDGNGHGGMNYYDMNFFKVDIKRPEFKEMAVEPEKPKNFNLMIEYSKKLSYDFPLVRVDFYEINGILYLGGLTFTPGAGFFKFQNPRYDRLLGDMITIDKSVAGSVNEEEKKPLNIISHNCVGGRIYQEKNEEYANPFMWCVIPPKDFYYLYTHYDEIDYSKIKMEKDKTDFKITVDDKFMFYYVHYKYSKTAKTPTLKSGIDVYYEKIEEYIKEKYFARLKRMKGKPLFIVTDREFVVRKDCNFKKDDLVKYLNKEDCIVVTCDKTIAGKNVIYVQNKNLDPKDIAKIILNKRVDL